MSMQHSGLRELFGKELRRSGDTSDEKIDPQRTPNASIISSRDGSERSVTSVTQDSRRNLRDRIRKVLRR